MLLSGFFVTDGARVRLLAKLAIVFRTPSVVSFCRFRSCFHGNEVCLEAASTCPTLANDNNVQRGRSAINSVSTGTPRAIFTWTSASKGFISLAEPGISCSIFPTESGWETNSTAPCVPKVVVPAKIMIIRGGVAPGTNTTTA